MIDFNNAESIDRAAKECLPIISLSLPYPKASQVLPF